MSTISAPWLLTARESRDASHTPPAQQGSTLTDATTTKTFSLRTAEDEFRVEVPEPLHAWHEPTLASLQRVLNLPRNWDSYGARTIDPATVYQAIQLIFPMLGPRTPTPAVVPTSCGGVQFEWHTRGIDLEIEFRSPHEIAACFEDKSEPDAAWSVDALYNLRPLKSALHTLSSR